MLPDPNFLSRHMGSEEEAAAFIARAPHATVDGPVQAADLIAYKGEDGWRVTTVANFQCDEYWQGRPEEGPSAVEILGGEQ